MMESNLLEETQCRLDRAGKTWDDVEYVILPDMSDFDADDCVEPPYFKGTAEEFKAFAEEFFSAYNAGYGGAEVPMQTAIVFRDRSWLARAEYDGSEWWNYYCCPTV
jgi:hypothetical protein